MKSNSFKPWEKYFLPFLAYLIVPTLLDFTHPYIAYTGKVVVTGAVLAYFWKQYKEIKFKKSSVLWSFLVGLIVFAVWVLPEVLFGQNLPGWYFLGEVTGFNPLTPSEYLTISITIVRVLGAVIIAPVIEELFLRSFLIRFLVDNDIDKVPIGKYTLLSFIVTVAFFGLAQIGRAHV